MFKSQDRKDTPPHVRVIRTVLQQQIFLIGTAHHHYGNIYIYGLISLSCFFSFFFLNPHPKTFSFSLLLISFFLREREKRQCEREARISCLLHTPRPGIVHAQTGDQIYTPGMPPNQELSPQCFSSRTTLQLSEPHQPGLPCFTT